jgi:hypothetical protein
MQACDGPQTLPWHAKNVLLGRAGWPRIARQRNGCGQMSGTRRRTLSKSPAVAWAQRPWFGKVFMNSPYGRIGPAFVQKVVREVKAGTIEQAVVLININHRVAIVTKEDKRANKPGFATRTQDTVIHEKRPALVLCDFDAKNMSASVCERIEKAGGFLAALCEVCPELASAGHVPRSSTSANIVNGSTGEEYPAKGQHVFVLVADGQDAKRFLYELHNRCWLAGLGWYVVGKAGSYWIAASSIGPCSTALGWSSKPRQT